MRILQLTPGTGSYYCGSCMRDNSLAKSLRRAGHDVVMGQLYLPACVEGEHAEQQGLLFMGGLNAFLQQSCSLFRHTPRWFDQLLDSPGILRQLSKYTGMTRAHDLGRMTVSMLQGLDGKQAKELRRLIDWIKTQPPFDVICLSNVLLVGMAAEIRKEISVPVICYLQGEDGFIDALIEPYRSQVWQLASEHAHQINGLIAVSDYYAQTIKKRLGLSDGLVRFAHNGIDIDLFTPANSPPSSPTIGFMARMHRDKGLHTLVDAFIKLKKSNRVPDAKLCVVGVQINRDDQFAAQLQKQIDDAGFGADVSFHPNVTLEEKLELLQGFSLLSVPATYGESFGLYVIEALACGVPVVQPNHAAFGEINAITGGGLLCEPDDSDDLAEKITQLLLDDSRRQQLGSAGRTAVQNYFTADHMAKRVVDAIEQLIK